MPNSGARTPSHSPQSRKQSAAPVSIACRYFALHRWTRSKRGPRYDPERSRSKTNQMSEMVRLPVQNLPQRFPAASPGQRFPNWRLLIKVSRTRENGMRMRHSRRQALPPIRRADRLRRGAAPCTCRSDTPTRILPGETADNRPKVPSTRGASDTTEKDRNLGLRQGGYGDNYGRRTKTTLPRRTQGSLHLSGFPYRYRAPVCWPSESL